MFDYLQQIRSFEKTMKENPWQLTSSAQVLWMRLNALADERGSLQIFLSRSEIEKITGISYATFCRARENLTSHGFLDFVPAARNCPAVYQIKKLYAEG